VNEADFLQNIRKRQSTTSHNQPAHPGRFPRPVRTLPSDWAAEFGQRLTAVGGHIYHVNNPETARLQLRDIITHLRGKSVPLQQAVITTHPILHDLELDALLPRLEIESFAMGHSSFNIQDADLGLTGVEYAIASSGTIVMVASPQHPRSASLLPPVHIAVVKQSQLLPDLAALADKLHADFPERPSSGIALITGPSRTADIEQTLSIGVHGPGELHVLVASP
jgi:L-lactate dehydrogenase complex protein LldG